MILAIAISLVIGVVLGWWLKPSDKDFLQYIDERSWERGNILLDACEKAEKEASDLRRQLDTKLDAITLGEFRDHLARPVAKPAPASSRPLPVVEGHASNCSCFICTH